MKIKTSVAPSLFRAFVFGVILGSTNLFAQAIRSNPGCRTSAVPRNDDGSSARVNLGFTVNLFGFSPRSIGLAQVNVQIPAGLTAGAQQLVLFANDVASAPVLVYVAP